MSKMHDRSGTELKGVDILHKSWVAGFEEANKSLNFNLLLR